MSSSLRPPLDIEQPDALVEYLRRTGRINAGESILSRTLSGGVSNRVVWVERPQAGGEAWVLKQALPKLRVAVDWFSRPERIHREALGLIWLARLAPEGSTPRLVFEDAAEHVLAMEAVPAPHENWKQRLLTGRLEPDHIRQFGCLLGTVHRGACEQREAVSRVFEDRSFFESLRLEPYYEFTAGQVPAAAPFLEQLLAETRATRLTLTHGDYSPKNVLVHRDRLVLLDHEVIHFGDPAFDLGFSITHLLAKALHVRPQREGFAEAVRAYWNHYRTTLGAALADDTLERRAVRHTLACLLARVAGRSPLEYLTGDERDAQANAALTLMARPPQSVDSLVDGFLASIARR